MKEPRPLNLLYFVALTGALAVFAVGLAAALSPQVQSELVEASPPLTVLVIFALFGTSSYSVFLLARSTFDKKRRKTAITDGSLDPISGLPGRKGFWLDLQSAIDKLGDSQPSHFSLVYFDIAGFDSLRHNFGYAAGDLVLREVADRLGSCLDAGDRLFRIGGEEFFAILADSGGGKDTQAFVDRVLVEMRRGFSVDDQAASISASIGVVLGSDPNLGDSALVDRARLAAKQARGLGQNRYVVFRPELQVQETRWDIAAELPSALSDGQMRVEYQPIVDNDRFRAVGFEALLRWTHPERGEISPAQFIPPAEDSGFITSLSSWVFEEVCRQVQKWQSRKDSRKFTISFNMSGMDFIDGDRLVRRMRDAIAKYEVDPRHLCMEVTEGILIQNIESTILQLRQMKDLGIQIRLDDFGTGYSSLSYIHKFPLDGIKIDKTFVSTMRSDKASFQIVKSIIVLAHELNMEAIAEGVERREELSMLQTLKCDAYQGYLFSRSMTANDAERFLDSGRYG